MRHLTLSLLAMLLPLTAAAAETDAGIIPPSSDSAADMFQLCGEAYINALPPNAIGFVINGHSEPGTFTFQVTELGFPRPATYTVPLPVMLPPTVPLFAVFQPVSGRHDVATVTLHAYSGKETRCGAITGGIQVPRPADGFPWLVEQLLP